MGKPKVFPAVLARTESELEQRIALVTPWKAALHLDVTDGHFARPKSATGKTVGKLPSGSEVHLMVNNPIPWKVSIMRWKPTTLILHVESLHLSEMIRWSRQMKMKIRLAIKTSTSITNLDPQAGIVDGFHVMLGPIGKYGSAIEPEMFHRVAYLTKKYPKHTSSVDVGIVPATWKKAQKAGATIASVGSYIFSSRTPKQRWLQISKTS